MQLSRGNSEWRTINDLAFKIREGNNGHKAVIDIYDHLRSFLAVMDRPSHSDLAAVAGLETVVALASAVLRRLLGQRGLLYEDIITYPKSAFLFAVFKLLDNHYLVDAFPIGRWISG